MGNPLLVFWKNIFTPDDVDRRIRRATVRVAAHSAAQASATIFLILRRMRAPLIVLA
jgi:voltage-gated potassium channel